MAHRVVRTLLDMAIADLNLKVECRWCGRWRIIESGHLMWRFRKKGWSLYVETIADHLRCAGCGRKDVIVAQVTAGPTEMQPLRHGKAAFGVVHDAPCPEGIDHKAWRHADLRERKRLVAKLRN